MGRTLLKWCPVLACMLLLSGCLHGVREGREVTVTLPDPYRSSVQILYRSIALQGDLERSAAGEVRLELKEPENFCGLTLLLQEGTLHAEYQELSFSVDNDAAPGAAALTLLKDALIAVDGQTLRPAERPETRLLQLENEHGQLEALLDGENFLPERITMEGLGFTARFSAS
ncbi:MAG: hypothetical protein HFG26_01585 [Provencibacterium sp.]|jgi:hypothetical protein|nr:hypothetical protein [Provencibacterium sp.]